MIIVYLFIIYLYIYVKNSKFVALKITNMDNYFRTYIQIEKYGSSVVDTISAFGMYCMSNPFKICSGVKEPVKRTWNDENGDDEYIPEDGLYMSSYENKVKFGFYGTAYGANERLKSFLKFLRGGMMNMYCEFNGIGRRHVRLKDVDTELHRDTRSGEDILIVTITFKFNDPTTDVKPLYNDKMEIVGLAATV